MYCSKCGKEISDSAVFCDKCGNKVGASIESEKIYTRETKSDGMSSEEKERKLRAVIVFIMVCLISMGAVLALLAEDSGALDLVLDFEYESHINALKEALSEYDILIKILLFGSIIVSSVVNYIIPFMKRDFEGGFKGVLSTGVFDALCPVIVFFILKTSEVSEYFTVNFFGFMGYIVYLFAVVCNVIAYKKAAEAETTAYYYNKKSNNNNLLNKLGANEEWKCKHCGTINKPTMDYCKDCGEYK
ncbi:MAG: zinc-ribbon domain-containing protein [Ruminiclostridium sp.]|nr:zinc-ribbon domain-containing protein [Ruminiclostridium sp.]